MYGKSNMETYIIICKIDSQQEFAVWLRKLKTGALYQPRGVGWGGRWERGSRGRAIYMPMADSCRCRAETITILYHAIILQLKKKK